MSNTQVGNVYQQIIQDVVDSSRVDFEEGGVEEAVLEELRRVCCFRLSFLLVMDFAMVVSNLSSVQFLIFFSSLNESSSSIGSDSDQINVYRILLW